MLTRMLQQIGIDGKDLQFTRNLFLKNQDGALSVNNQLTPQGCIKIGVHHGCIMSPNLFSLYSELILRVTEENWRDKGWGKNINNIRHPDDTVNTEAKPQTLLSTSVQEASKEHGIKINIVRKTETTIIPKKPNPSPCSININDNIITTQS